VSRCASDPRPSRRGRSRHRWSCRTSLSLRTGRAGRTRRPRARLRVDIRRKNTAHKPNRNLFGQVEYVPGRSVTFADQIQASRHRAPDAGAVLGVVNALRCASTRPSAGPAGIDDASARHVSGTYAMALSVSITQAGLTRQTHRRMLASSRQCRTALPPFAPKANGARIRSAPTGHGIERNPKHRRPMHDDRERFVGASIELRTPVPLAAHHPQDHAPSRGRVHRGHCIALVLTERNGRSNHSRSSPLGA
jgi:hypothetical protein